MSYDTAMPMESLYGGYVAQQTRLALDATPRGADLLMGLPAFHTDDMGHRESAETVAAAARGARLGLSREDAHRERFGVALYVDLAATPGDWAAYRRNWGRRTDDAGMRSQRSSTLVKRWSLGKPKSIR